MGSGSSGLYHLAAPTAGDTLSPAVPHLDSCPHPNGSQPDCPEGPLGSPDSAGAQHRPRGLGNASLGMEPASVSSTGSQPGAEPAALSPNSCLQTSCTGSPLTGQRRQQLCWVLTHTLQPSVWAAGWPWSRAAASVEKGRLHRTGHQGAVCFRGGHWESGLGEAETLHVGTTSKMPCPLCLLHGWGLRHLAHPTPTQASLS